MVDCPGVQAYREKKVNTGCGFVVYNNEDCCLGSLLIQKRVANGVYTRFICVARLAHSFL